MISCCTEAFVSASSNAATSVPGIPTSAPPNIARIGALSSAECCVGPATVGIQARSAIKSNHAVQLEVCSRSEERLAASEAKPQRKHSASRHAVNCSEMIGRCQDVITDSFSRDLKNMFHERKISVAGASVGSAAKIIQDNRRMALLGKSHSHVFIKGIKPTHI